MLLLLIMLGCGGTDSAVPEAIVDGWPVARDFLRTNNHNCFASMVVYCDRSEAFIDPILQETLDRAFDGEMPNTELRAVRVARRARATYSYEQTRTEEARDRLMERIEGYYEAPAVLEKGSFLSAEVGVVPGKWERVGKSGYRMFPGPKMWGQDWRVTEAVRFTRLLMADHPGATTIAMTVQLPQMGAAGGYRKQTWTYRASTQRLSLTLPVQPSDSWHTDKIVDWDAFAEAAKDVNRKAMMYCGGARQERACEL